MIFVAVGCFVALSTPTLEFAALKKMSSSLYQPSEPMSNAHVQVMFHIPLKEFYDQKGDMVAFNLVRHAM